ncbi:tumor necrosis factor receptor superfamily member 25 isoform X2 [Cygnus olor]|uniref:tumor necrosis factor receptor superfamily member 25 isoform X2 n=1 Tax=Cygnus olor TaxID=8869 RepID=UPI001ADE27B3|nr:tumor necrosis factor receptor superfamily member 25 isoform X2 [Cygnus olor]
MKRHCPGAASVFLAVLWLLASGLLLLGCQDCAVSQGQRGPARLPARPRRLAAKPSCPAGMNWIDAVQQCCPQCPPGTYLKNPCSMHGKGSDCEACPDGTYHSQPNTRTKCHVCYECDHHGELAVPRAALCCAMLYHPAHPHTCSFPARAEQLLGHQQRRLWLQAWPLPQLPERALQRILLQQVPALPGEAGPAALLRHAGHAVRQLQAQLLRRGQRVPAVPHVSSSPGGVAWPAVQRSAHVPSPCRSTPETCGEECQQACGGSTRGSGLQYLLLALTVPLFMGAFVIYKRRWLQHRALVGSPLLTVPPQGCPSPMAHTFSPTQEAVATETVLCQVCEHGPSTARKSPESWALHKCPDGAALLDGRVEPSAPQEPSTARGPESHPRSPQRCTLLQGSQLYAVINVVPVRRWKEFMRVLELRDTEIELVEMEVTHFRDQQYEMLKRWCQQTSATLDRIFAALEHMELAGCAEALRQSLSAGP